MEKLIQALKDIQDRAEHEADWLKRAGEKQGQYLIIARLAKQAVKQAEK